MTESAESVQGAPESEQQSDPPESGDSREPTASTDSAESAEGEEAAEHNEAAEVGVEPIASVAERNAYSQNTITVGGDFIGSIDGDKRAAVPTVDITSLAGELSEGFVDPPSFSPTVKALEERQLALLIGGGCGNRVTATVALHRTGHKPIVELPGALAAVDLVEAVQRACKKKESVGVLVESVDTETLTSLAGFRLRHLHSVLPARSAVVFTTRAQGHIASDHELPAIKGVPPDSEEMVEVLARRSALGEKERERCHEARALLPQPVGPATAVQLIALAATAKSADELAATIDGQSQVLDEWLGEQPDARHLAALAAAACLDGLPSSDFDDAAEYLTTLLEGEVEPPSEPPRFGAREKLWPAGLARYRQEQVMTYFGWQETEIVEICPPHTRDGVIAYLWSHLGGEFRRPFLQWLLELPTSSNNRLAYVAARAAGVLFARDPLTIERELLRPWALEGHADLRNAAGFALGIPVMIGADPTGARRLVKKWSHSSSGSLRAAAIAAYGGPLGIWDPSAAAASHLWEAGWAGPELQELADESLAALFVGGRAAGLARGTAMALLSAVESKVEVLRAYAILPSVIAALTSGRGRARESLEALLEDSESKTFADLATLLALAFNSNDGRESARRAMLNLLHAIAAGQIGRDVVERLIREMKSAAAERGQTPQLGSQLRQLLKAEDRKGGQLQDVARSLHETFYDQGKGGKSIENK
ncbi:MAG TPA: hypothetical protein VFJ64_09075 [Solirubrobacterales bacterium]|nr:hypothetical protein [Solirubrobacterales bacterium]